jgi:hypothetical protein
MIDVLDNILEQLFITTIDEITDPSQIRLEAPDENWRSSLGQLNRNALNVYLVEMRENRKLRSNERTRTPENGVIHEQPAPARVDCHYLISAWSPTAELTPLVEPVLDEHALLYEAAAALIHAGGRKMGTGYFIVNEREAAEEE